MDDQRENRGRGYDARLARALGRTIKVLRTDRGVERKDLALNAGLSYSYLTEIENGTKPASNTILVPIAEALGLQLYELIAAAEARLQSQEAPADETQSSLQQVPAPSVYPRMEGPRELRNAGIAPPSARRTYGIERRSGAEEQRVQRSLFPVEQRMSRATDIGRELTALLRDLSPEDQERVLDLARRLAR